MQRIRKGDTVIVTTGKDKGRTGEVLRVTPSDNRVLVQGINMVKRHAKPAMGDPGGIQEREAPIHVSNVAHFDPDSNSATRVGFRVLEDGRKVRFAKSTGEQID
jgi:large subunit ribosomal protein L24